MGVYNNWWICSVASKTASTLFMNQWGHDWPQGSSETSKPIDPFLSIEILPLYTASKRFSFCQIHKLHGLYHGLNNLWGQNEVNLNWWLLNDYPILQILSLKAVFTALLWKPIMYKFCDLIWPQFEAKLTSDGLKNILHYSMALGYLSKV